MAFVQAVNSNTRRCLQFAVFFEQHAADFMKPSNCIVVSFEIKTITSDFYMPFFPSGVEPSFKPQNFQKKSLESSTKSMEMP